MNLSPKIQKARAGFTLGEVAIALAVVAFGLVTVLGVLPLGLNVQRDNREDTLIKNDGEYWMHALRGGRLALDSLNHVEWMEVHTPDLKVYRAEFAALQFDGYPTNSALWPVFHDPAGNPQLPPVSYRGSLKQATWRGDVIGWLSTPDSVAVRKIAKVRPMGSTVLQRKYGEKTVGKDGRVMYRNEGGDLTFSYLLKSSVIERAPNFWEIKLTMEWPILEEGPSADTVKTGPGKRTFVSYIHAPLEKAQARWGLKPDERSVYDTLIADTPLTVDQITQFLIDTKVATSNRQQWDAGGVLALLQVMANRREVRSDSANRLWLPQPLYDSYGMYSLRSPAGYSGVADAAGVFAEFAAPDNGYFQETYFFRPPIAAP